MTPKTKYKFWQFLSIVISFTIGGLVNPATFGLGMSNNIGFNIGVRIVLIAVIYSILSQFGKPKKIK